MAIGQVIWKDAAPEGDAPLRMTWEEYLDWLDEDKHAEWVNGEVIMHSPVSRMHNDVGRFLINVLSAYVEENQLGEIFYEPFQMKIGGPGTPGRAPDIAFVARENLGRIQVNLLDGPADLIVEIISPESRARDRGEKFYEYEAGGIGEYWLIDPAREQAEFYQRDARGVYQSIAPDGDGVYHSSALPGLQLAVEWLWQKPLPSLISVLKTWKLV